jgi:uncharacterized membrane protein
VEELTQANVELIAQLEAAARQERTRAERVVDAITGFCGRLSFIYVHVAWFAGWIVWNVVAPDPLRFDKYPFEFLTFTVSLEAILLSTVIMISQNRQGHLDERRNHLELQINLLSEQENTKMLWLLERIAEKVQVDISDDPNVKVLEEATHPEQLLAQIDQSLNRTDEMKQEGGEA